MTINFPEALDVIERAANDPALRAVIATRLGLTDSAARSIGPRPVGLPPFAEITALQITLFDNGSKPVGAQIETWNERGYAKPRQSGYSKLGAIKLYDHKTFRTKLRKLRNRNSGVSADWQDCLAFFLDQFGEGHLFGPVIQTKPGHGVCYLEGQMVVADIEGGCVAYAALFNGAQKIEATYFARTSSMGKSLGSNVMGSARLDFTGDNDDWATESGLVLS